MKVAAVVILYHPAEMVLSNIQSYYEYVEKVFVFDNSEVQSSVKDELMKLSKIEFFQDFSNRGIAERLNSACKKAVDKQYDWLLTMDQDTKFAPNTINKYFDCINSYADKSRVAMFGTESSRQHNASSEKCISQNADELITSGSLLNLSLVEEIGGFDEQLFIDYVDNDYCYRAKSAGYLLIKLTNIFLLHELGNLVNASSIKSLFILKKKKEIHSPLRCYYMFRNMLFLESRYKYSNPKLAKKIRKDVLSRIKVTILYGRETLKILKYLRAARIDYKQNQMGKIREEIIAGVKGM